MEFWYSEPLSIHAQKSKALSRNVDNFLGPNDFISSINLKSMYGENIQVEYNLDSNVYLSYHFPSIEKGEYKLVWVISSDANWDGLVSVEILTLDLVTMKFSLSFLSNLIDDATLYDDKFDGGTNFDIELRNAGKSLLFTIKDTYQKEQATYLFHWKDASWSN
ncbi:hypothetical protein LCL85_14150 [Vibrio alginolyticus]|nr:hypothetical protein [Vibrio alginolyticus]